MRSSGGPRSILLLLPTLALACASPSPTASDQQAAPAAAPGSPKRDAAPADDAAAGAVEATEMRRAEPIEEAAKNQPTASPAPAPIGGHPPGTEVDRSQSRLDIAVPSINGGLNRDIIRRIASDHADEIRECHGRALASMPDLAGTLLVEVELDADGNVSEAKLGDDSSLRHRDVESCVLALIEGWSFPDAGGKGTASLSFAF